MTRRSRVITEVWPEERIEISPMDAEELGVADGEKVLVCSRQGELKAKVRVTDKSRSVAFMSFHHQDVLTNAALGPQAKTPEYKAAPYA
jgi:predicted molibdopterin-dependent oxidoreductase YjgC